MKASDVIARADYVLQDAGDVRWTAAEKLLWIADGQRAIVIVRPDASALNTTFTLAAGTKQTLPTDGLRLMDMIRNVGSDGAPGAAINPVDREILDGISSLWHAAKPGITKNFTYDNRDPKTFYVYPPAVAGTKVDLVYSRAPAEVTDQTADLVIQDIYMEPLVNYVLARAYAKDAEASQNMTLASAYMGQFNAMLGIKTRKDAAFSPELNDPALRPDSAALSQGGV